MIILDDYCFVGRNDQIGQDKTRACYFGTRNWWQKGGGGAMMFDYFFKFNWRDYPMIQRELNQTLFMYDCLICVLARLSHFNLMKNSTLSCYCHTSHFDVSRREHAT